MKAFLDAGAKAVIAPSIEPNDVRGSADGATGERDTLDIEFGRFVIEDEEAEELSRAGSPGSDWGDSETDKDGLQEMKEYEEKDLATFFGVLYDALFREGVPAEVALQRALDVQPKRAYVCHLPTR